MSIVKVVRSVYWGSFSSLNRNILFWLLVLYGDAVTASRIVIGFAVVTIIKSIIETPAHSLLASQTRSEVGISSPRT